MGIRGRAMGIRGGVMSIGGGVMGIAKRTARLAGNLGALVVESRRSISVLC